MANSWGSCCGQRPQFGGAAGDAVRARMSVEVSLAPRARPTEAYMEEGNESVECPDRSTLLQKQLQVDSVLVCAMVRPKEQGKRLGIYAKREPNGRKAVGCGRGRRGRYVSTPACMEMELRLSTDIWGHGKRLRSVTQAKAGGRGREGCEANRPGADPKILAPTRTPSTAWPGVFRK